MLNFQWPLMALLLPIPFLVRYFLPSRRAENPQDQPEIYFPHLAGLKTAFSQSDTKQKSKKRNLIWALYLAWMFLVIGLMRPQIVREMSEVNDKARDLMLAVDLSASMQSLDFSQAGKRISRLDVAKDVVKDFVEKRSGDRIGLVLFGEHAYLQAPLTSDTQSVAQMLDNSLPGMAGDSTAIGDAIGLAVKNLRDRPALSRAIILLTDGEDNSSTIPPLQAAKLAKEYGIRIYTIMIGKEGIVPIPDNEGNIVMVENHVDTSLTRKIAELTNGEFYRATDRSSLARIYDRIDELEKSDSDPKKVLIHEPLYQYPLGAALILLAACGLMTQIRREFYELQSA